MKNTVRVLRYSLLIAIVAGLSIAYGYRELLFPKFFVANQDTTTPVAADAKKPTREPGSISSSTPGSDKTVVTTKDTTRITTGKVVSSGADKRVVQPVPAPEPTSEPVQKQPVSKPGPTSEAEPVKMATAPKKPAEAKKIVTAPEVPTPPSVSKMPGSPAPVDQPSVSKMPMSPAPAHQPAIPAKSDMHDTFRSYTGLINQARQLYWQRKPAQAIEMYQKASQQIPGNPNPYGEMANIYYSQGQWEQAGEAYYQAAIRLLDAGQLQRVYSLQGMIQGLKPERAKDLDLKLRKQKND